MRWRLRYRVDRLERRHGAVARPAAVSENDELNTAAQIRRAYVAASVIIADVFKRGPEWLRAELAGYVTDDETERLCADVPAWSSFFRDFNRCDYLNTGRLPKNPWGRP